MIDTPEIYICNRLSCAEARDRKCIGVIVSYPGWDDGKDTMYELRLIRHSLPEEPIAGGCMVSEEEISLATTEELLLL